MIVQHHFNPCLKCHYECLHFSCDVSGSSRATLQLFENTFGILALTPNVWTINLVPGFQPKQGGFQLLNLIIPELKSHVIPYKFKSSHWLKLQHSDWIANFVKDFFLQMNFPPMGALEFIRNHMTFKLRYNQI